MRLQHRLRASLCAPAHRSLQLAVFCFKNLFFLTATCSPPLLALSLRGRAPQHEALRPHRRTRCLCHADTNLCRVATDSPRRRHCRHRWSRSWASTTARSSCCRQAHRRRRLARPPPTSTTCSVNPDDPSSVGLRPPRSAAAILTWQSNRYAFATNWIATHATHSLARNYRSWLRSARICCSIFCIAFIYHCTRIASLHPPHTTPHAPLATLSSGKD